MENIYLTCKDNNQKVSIITASYNYENYIKETIESVLNQTYPNWEMIIVDDGSKDNSVDVIKNYCKKDNRIRLFQHKNRENKGLIETIKLGLEKASSDWIIFLESDDYIEKNYIEEKLNIIKKYPDVKFIFNDVQMFGDKEIINNYRNHFSVAYEILKSYKYPANISKDFLNLNLVPTFSAVMLKKDIMQKVNFNCIIPKLLDYHMWTQLASKYDFYYLDKKLTNWRMSPKSYINNKEEDSLNKMFYFKGYLIPKNIYKGNLPIFSKIKFYITFILQIIKRFRKKLIRFNLKEKRLMIIGKSIIGKDYIKNDN